MLRLCHGHPPRPSGVGRNPGLHRVPGQGPRHQAERGHGHEARARHWHHPQARGQHVPRGGRLGEEPELCVLQVPEHDHGALLPRDARRGGSGPAGPGQGEADHEDEHHGGRDHGQVHVKPIPERRRRVRDPTREQLLEDPREGEVGRDHREVHRREDELQHDRQRLEPSHPGAEVQAARRSQLLEPSRQLSLI